jgi:methanogenic corrinoid protein MtbC1
MSYSKSLYDARLFESEEYFVPELLLSGGPLRGAIELLRPPLGASGAREIGRVVIGTVAGADGCCEGAGGVVGMARSFMEGRHAH